jgi:ubiquinone/menaquinone biosynthesis C-methylase UbiE
MDKAMPSIWFRFMSWSFRKRDATAFTSRFLDEAGIRAGDTVLDFGCGPGSFSVAAAHRTGSSGRVHACDIQPLAGGFIKRKAGQAGVANVMFLCAGSDTGLPAGSVDVILLYDVLHMLSEPGAVLKELLRVLRPGGLLSVSDHHMEEARIRSVVRGSGFEFERSGAATLRFVRSPETRTPLTA